VANSTFYVALPYSRTVDGVLVPGEVSWCADPIKAAKEAERLADTSGGAVAFSRGVDLDTGTFEPIAIIKRIGFVPSSLS
jgi:hypothetical protein